MSRIEKVPHWVSARSREDECLWELFFDRVTQARSCGRRPDELESQLKSVVTLLANLSE